MQGGYELRSRVFACVCRVGLAGSDGGGERGAGRGGRYVGAVSRDDFLNDVVDLNVGRPTILCGTCVQPMHVRVVCTTDAA